MRLHEFLDWQIKKWNSDKKCSFCWEFYAPLTEDALNKQQLKEDCHCVHVMMTRDNVIAFGSEYRYNEKLSVNTDVFTYKNFKLHFLKRQALDLNNHIEILGHDTKLSKINFLTDLEECISELELDICEYLGRNWTLTKFQAHQLINYRDNNYTGYRVDITLKTRKVNAKRRSS